MELHISTWSAHNVVGSNGEHIETTTRKARKEDHMGEDHVYKKVELVGSSTDSIDSAIKNAIGRASKSLRQLDWFEVDQIRGHIEDGKVARFQVVLKAGFRLDE
jgi:flavin-binding protein dodecin